MSVRPKHPWQIFFGIFWLLATSAGGAAAQCAPDGGGLAGWSYCPHGPASELCGGTTLYWTGPCSNWRPPYCRYTPHYLAGHRPVQAALPALWYASAEFVPLIRDQDESIAFQSLGTGTQNIALGTGDFEHNFAAGGRVTLGVALTDEYRLEGTWLGAHSWDDRALINDDSPNPAGGNGRLYSIFTNFGRPAQIGLDFNRQALIEMESDFQSGEINIRKRLLLPPGPFEANALIGARILQIDDGFRYFSASELPLVGGTTNNLATQTSNDLVGIQLGLQGQWLTTNCSWIDLDLKGALCNNSAEQVTRYDVTDAGGTATTIGTAERDVTSFAGEVAVWFNYQMTRSITIRAGYQSLWVTGLALADENAAQPLSNLSLGGPLLEHDGQITYHGPNLGLIWTR